MSQKALKRKIRRGTDDSDTDFKLPAHYTKKDIVNTSDDGVKTRQNQNGSGSNYESDSDDNVSLKVLVNAEDNSKCDSPNRSRSATPKITSKSKDTEDDQQSEKECSNGNDHGSENGQNEAQKGDLEGKTVEMEPLMLDSEDPELMFPEEGSESELDFSDKGSPVLSRSVTRRSHTRSIPTPKTPKLANDHQNGSAEPEQTCAKIDMNPIISVERLPESVLEKAADETGESSQTSTLDTNSENASPEDQQQRPEETCVDVAEAAANLTSKDNLTLDSCVSAAEDNESLVANVTGDDATRNIEFSCGDPSLLDESADSQHKNRSLRSSISSRRSIRPNAEDVYRRRAFHNAKDEERGSLERIATSGMKRKQRSTTPDGPKRYKLEPDPEKSPGFLSYIASPFHHIKNRLSSSRTLLPTSTPILKGYKANPLLATEGNAKGDEGLDETSVIPEKKWCAIM